MKTTLHDAFLLAKGYSISTDKALIDFEMVFNYLSKESYWSKGIATATLQKAIEHSLCFSVYYKEKQVGFARVITDYATFAYICDVFVLEGYRGMGLSKWLMKTVKAHPELQGLRRWSLLTADAQGLYQQFGFTPVEKPERFMEIFTPYISE